MQVQKVSVRVGNLFLANAWVDPGGVRGEGGPDRPTLVVPLVFWMTNTPEDSMISIVWLRATLSLAENAAAQSVISSPTSEVLIDNMPLRTLPNGGTDRTVALRFVLTADEVERLETHRHGVPDEVITLYMAIDAVAAALQSHNNGINPPPTPWDRNYGLFSDVRPFWNTKVDLVRFTVEQSPWVRDVLPGLGYNRRRLIELTFPPALPDHGSAVREWDKARRAFDTKRYGDCVAECRDVLSMWVAQLGATKAKSVAQMIAEREGWDVADRRIGFIDGLWKTATDVANVEHHPEGTRHEQTFSANDARLMLHVTAALSEYISRS